ncbi:MAG: tripartite tricarboxylate transporter substrate binding protein [Proteobacteria bacterium]|nr:tripartite tricarboxylate transporter substrate binding protein [Burkholderiales bacterium]
MSIGCRRGRVSCGAVLLALIGAGFGAATVRAQPQPYPVKPIRYVISFAPGGSNDILARILGARLQESMGQTVLIDNRPGAGGNIGAEAIARASPDGYTVGNISATHAINASLYPKLSYDVLRDFTAIIRITEIALLLAVHPGVPAKGPKELVALSQSRKLAYASSGIGTPGHLAAEMLAGFGAKDLVHVPHKGGGPAIVDLISGNVEMLFINLPEMIPHVKAGKMRALAVAGSKRESVLPDVPTFIESGFAGFDLGNWIGVVGPAGVSRPIVERLNAEIAKVLKEPGSREKIEAQGFTIVNSTPDEFAAYLKTERDKWGKLVKVSGAKAE